jgi:hypothetical protein
MVYIRNDDDSKNYDNIMETLKPNILFKISDQCPTAMFQADDMSLQQVEKIGKNNWAFFIELDWTSKNGYLASELPKCKSADHLPQTQIRVQIYAHKEDCCQGIKDYNQCNHCDVSSVDHHWRKEPLAYEMTVTGTQFKWRLSNFVLEGTKFTSKDKLNFLKLGKPVNDGNVDNAQESAFIELGAVKTFSIESELSKFKDTVTGKCVNSGFHAKEIFKNVKPSVNKGSDIQFSCSDSPELCKCLVLSSKNNVITNFRGENGEVTFISDGQFVSYQIITQNAGRRRRLLYDSKEGC